MSGGLKYENGWEIDYYRPYTFDGFEIAIRKEEIPFAAFSSKFELLARLFGKEKF